MREESEHGKQRQLSPRRVRTPLTRRVALSDLLPFLISSTTTSLDQRIEQTGGICGGKPRIAGHRITVQDVVVWHERLGWSVDQIASEYDLSLADVYAALDYYFAHREEIDRSIEESRAFIEKIKTEQSSEQTDPLAEDG